MAGGGITAYGEYVYVVKQGTLYKFTAYDLTLIKKTELSKVLRAQRTRRSGNGTNGQSGIDGDGGAGGRGGDAGTLDAEGAISRSEDVAAFGEYVYILSGNTVHKLVSEDLQVVKSVQLK